MRPAHRGYLPQIDRIHVVFKNPVLVFYLLFKLKGKVLLLNLSLKLSTKEVSLVQLVSTLFLMSCCVIVLAPH